MQEATDLPPVSPTPAKAAPQRGWLHWGIIVGAFYLVVLVVITVPVVYASFAKLDGSSPLPWEVYTVWQYWAIIGLILLGQFLLLRVPVRLAMKRPVSRSSVWLPIIVSGFWFAVLVIGLGFTLMELFKIDAQAWPVLALAAAIASWVAWTIVFARMTRGGDPKQIDGPTAAIAVDAARQHLGTADRGAVPHCGAAPGGLLRGHLYVCGHHHGHVGDVAGVRAGGVLPLLCAVAAAEEVAQNSCSAVPQTWRSANGCVGLARLVQGL